AQQRREDSFSLGSLESAKRRRAGLPSQALDQLESGLIELEGFRVRGEVGKNACRHSGVERSRIPVTRDNGIHHGLENLPRGQSQRGDDVRLGQDRIGPSPEQRDPQDTTQEGTPTGSERKHCAYSRRSSEDPAS